MSNTATARLLEMVRRIDERLGLPAVVQIHVPSAALAEGREAEFCAVRLADGAVGLSFVLLGDTLARLQGWSDSLPKPAWILACGAASADPVERALGMATVNAVSQSLFARAGYTPDFATNSLGSLDLQPGDHLGMVGYFTPLVGRVAELGIPLTVIELKAELVREEAGLTVTLDPARLAACNKIVCTSTVLLNDTLDGLLAHARHAAQFAIIGPGAGCLPDPLFERGVTVMGGTLIRDADLFFDLCARGESWSPAARKYCIRAGHGYPGLEALLAAASRSG